MFRRIPLLYQELLRYGIYIVYIYNKVPTPKERERPFVYRVPYISIKNRSLYIKRGFWFMLCLLVTHLCSSSLLVLFNDTTEFSLPIYLEFLVLYIRTTYNFTNTEFKRELET